MSLFQCQHCGCVENTALSHQGIGNAEWRVDWYDWTGIEDRKGKLLCSACSPKLYADGTSTTLGKWHGEFDRCFLHTFDWVTDKQGNLKNSKTGSTDFKSAATTSK